MTHYYNVNALLLATDINGSPFKETFTLSEVTNYVFDYIYISQKKKKKSSLMLGIRIRYFNFCNLSTSKVVLIIQLNRVFTIRHTYLHYI